MKAFSYTVLFAILSPGLLLLVPSVFRAVLKNPLSLLAIVLNIAFFYMALTHIKYIPYLNTLEGFQDIIAPQEGSTGPPPNSGPPVTPDGNPIPDACISCVKKSNLFLQISTCETECQKEGQTSEQCNTCLQKNLPGLIKKHCTNICPASMTTGTVVPP
uniref:Uncharacterized protein n=1 Tax=viral metagenome TaxID=1070528 RepID=A0A6C0BKL1_9ZZZZ